MSNATCGDDRFDVIERAKEDLIKSTNIKDSPKEMDVLDSVLYRCWQMGWLGKYAVESKPPCKIRYFVLVETACRAVGRKLTSTRDASNTLIRSIVAYQLVNEGYHYSEIGKAMRRDHSTISHYIKKVENMLSVPNSYKREMDIFNEFVRLVGD